MQINVAQLLKEPVGSSRKYETDEKLVADNIDSIKGGLVLIRTHRGLLVKGKMSASVVSLCSRCLKPITYQVNYEFEEEAFPSIDISTGLSLTTDPESLTIDNTHMLDLTDMLVQYTLLTMPIKPLCSPDCAGLCPQCGTNLNDSKCQCSNVPTDERWLKLAILKKERGF